MFDNLKKVSELFLGIQLADHHNQANNNNTNNNSFEAGIEGMYDEIWNTGSDNTLLPTIGSFRFKCGNERLHAVFPVSRYLSLHGPFRIGAKVHNCQ